MKEKEKETESKLPSDRLSNLIKVAITDAKRLHTNQRKNYHPHFADWHSPSSTLLDTPVKCRICLTGAVLAGTLQGDITKCLLPHDYSADADKLRALNAVRTGDLPQAHNFFYGREASLAQRHAYKKLKKLIKHDDFIGWRRFLRHVESLEVLARELASFEDALRIEDVPF